MKEGKKKIWWYIATWFGSGLSPFASGTAGSLAALPFAYLIQVNFGSGALLLAALAIFFLGWWASNQYLRHRGGEDPGEIVVDEVAGQWLLLSVLPYTWQGYLAGFLLFRLFDVIKPWPVSWADRKVKGGLGVMLDDMLAALYPAGAYMAYLYYTGV
jgi:phosphatidylglycerophosphatase A